MSFRGVLDQLRATTDFLNTIAADRTVLADVPAEERERFLKAVALAYHPDRNERRRMAKAAARDRRAARVRQRESLRASTGIRTLRKPVAHSPNVFPPCSPDALDAPGDENGDELQHCYVCKVRYREVHHFYDQMCPACAAQNFAKRTELADLRGRVAIVTGARVKIGYHASLKLLRSGARVVATTRFPRNAASRYAAEADFDQWKDRLEIVGLDLRHTPSVEAFCRSLLDRLPRLDFIINNACQTVCRPPAFYAHMIESERGETPVPGLLPPAGLSQVALTPDDVVPQAHLFPAGQLDQDLQQVDLRDRNSWRLLLHEVSTVELLEVQLVNAVAPFVLNARLKPLMTATPERDKHIVNVSAMEGQFYRRFKTTRHPHTNMAKAALNMMTRTSAAEYHADGIHMNSVDTGWITDEDPVQIASRKEIEHRFSPPLDAIDGAARICDPIIAGFNTGRHIWGQFLKDFRPTDW